MAEPTDPTDPAAGTVVAPPDDPPAPAPRAWVRALVVALILSLIGGALYVLFYTTPGAQLRQNPHIVGKQFRDWVAGHQLVAPLILFALYVAVSMSLMPVWWLQILSGYGFGLWLGVTYSLAGAAMGAVCSYGASRLLMADYVRRKFEARHAKLRALDEKMGHNGLLIVMATRLTHVLPFGISNYLFGISRITVMDVVLGTVLGNAPMITFYVAVGTGMHPQKNFWFMTALAVINVLLLVPVGLRYWKPEWFKRIGVE